MSGPDPHAVQTLASSREVTSHLGQRNTGVYIVRQDGLIVWASPSMLEATGRAPEELVGRNGWDVFVPHEDLGQVAAYKARLADGDGIFWMRLRMPDGRLEWYRVDAWVRFDLIVCAFRRERDRTRHVLHFEQVPRPRGA